ncbi:MAG: hexose kinase [Rhodobacteraceae bacterium]|nr:hexose kinase [Paracoccaceae bacterium]
MKLASETDAAILTVTMNPAVDVATSVPRLLPGVKLRCDTAQTDPGGGGVNVARVVTRLGGRCRALVVAGGAMGEQLLSLMAAEGVAAIPFRIAQQTRQNFAVTESDTGQQYRFILPGPVVDDVEGDRILAEIADRASDLGPACFVVLSGSFPPGLAPDFVAQCVTRLHPQGHRLCLDTSGDALRHLVGHPTDPPYLLRMDQQEAEQLRGTTLSGVAETADYAAELVRRGVAEVVVLGCGADGSVMATADARYLCRAAKVPVVSTTGAGDSFMGALVLALARGEAPEQALRWGVAAASAAVMTHGTELCESGAVADLLEQCEVAAI